MTIEERILFETFSDHIAGKPLGSQFELYRSSSISTLKNHLSWHKGREGKVTVTMEDEEIHIIFADALGTPCRQLTIVADEGENIYQILTDLQN
jgi:hypothetical protein